MRKIFLTLVALAVVGVGVPIMGGSSSADARHYRGHKKIVVIKHRGRGHHRGWYKKRHHRSGAIIVR